MKVLVAGNVNIDVIMGEIAPWPHPGQEVVAESYQFRMGGSAGITALALQGMQVPFELISNVGDDALGNWLVAQLRKVGCTPVISPTATSVTVAITHPDKERSFFSHLGHLLHYPTAALETALDQAHSGDLLLVCGYFLLSPLRREAKRFLQDARARGLLTLLDTGHPPEGWTPAIRQELLSLLPHLDYFLPNHDELQGLTGAMLAPGLRWLAGHTSARTIVKLGPAGTAYLDEGEVCRVPAPRVNAIDTVGAGDTFNAGLLAGLQRQQHWQSALEAAVRAASLAVASSPRRYPTWEDVRGMR